MSLRSDQVGDQQNIQDFIQARFNGDELRDFCLAYFPRVHDEFTTGMARGQMVRLLVDYCLRHERIPDLMAALQRERPEQFQQYFSWQTQQRTPTPQLYTPNQRNPKRIFISHAYQDADFAQKLAKDLRAKDWTVWIAPDSIRPGEKWVEAINRGLEESSIFLLVLSPEAVNSGWVRQETNAAITLQHKGLMNLIPLDVRAAAIPPIWEGYQMIPFRSGYKSGWQALVQTLTPPAANVPVSSGPPAARSQTFPSWMFYGVAAVLLVLIAADWLLGEFSGEGGQIISPQPTTEFAAQTAAPEVTSALPPTALPSSTSTPTFQAGDTRVLALPSGLEVTQVFVPAGLFLMGSDQNDSNAREDEFPQHEVSLDAFWLDQTEATNAQFAEFVEDTGYETTAEQEGNGYTINDSGEYSLVEGADWLHPYGPLSDINGLDNHPVLLVSWEDADAFCQWRDSRLPTEAEWEYAARGPGSPIYPWGDEFDGTRLNFCDERCEFDWRDATVNDGYERTAPVGNYPAGASWVGAFDMSGNVWEWVNDWYDGDYDENAPSENPMGPQTGQSRVLRGGAWDNGDQIVRAAFRDDSQPEYRNDDVGFRCAQE